METNPATDCNKQQESGARERFLTNEEIRAVWTALPVGDYGDLVRLLLLTGQRREEFASLQWSEVDFETGQITLAGERTKNGRPHVIPISGTVMAILPGPPAQPRS